MIQPEPLIQGLLIVLVLTAAVFDLRFRRIPNWLCLAGIVAGLAGNFYLTQWSGLGAALEGAGLALLVYVPLFLLRAMGAGDGKLMAAVGALLGPSNWFGVFVLTAVFGAVLGLAVATRKSRLRRTFRNFYLLLMSLRLGHAPYNSNPDLDVTTTAGIRMPHAIPIALGSLTYLVALRFRA